jgi:hypothetical protein
MVSSLIPERPIVISPTLAATIGLDEAVMLQVLHDVAQLGARAPGPWREIAKEDLLRLLPFWTEQECQRVSASLRDKGVLLITSAPLDQSDRLRFSLETARATAQPAVAPRAPQKLTGGKTLIANRWHPDDELLRQLALHGISREFAQAQIEEFVLYWSDRGDPAYSWNAKFRSHVIRRWREHEAAAAEPDDRPRPIRPDWRPDPDALELLERAGVSAQFVEDAIPEFLLYWTERGEAARTWNSRFVTHVKRQWARFSATIEMEGEPRRMHAAWQPSGDVFDILRMANIDHEFARTLVPEFVMYWCEAGEAHPSWNSKFLQHVKNQWARSHAAPGTEHTHADRQGSGGGGSTRARSLVEDLSDRSWAE